MSSLEDVPQTNVHEQATSKCYCSINLPGQFLPASP